MGFEVVLDIPARSLNANHLALNAEISTDQLAQRGMQSTPVPLTNCRVWDAMHSMVVGTPASDDLGLVTGMPGTDVPMLSAGDLKAAGATTRKVAFQLEVPSNYEDGETFEVRLRAAIETTVADTSCTVDLEVFKGNGAGAAGSDLCTTSASSINSLTPANVDFTVDGSGLDPGDLLTCIVSIACNDAATVTAVTPVIYSITRRCDLRG